MADIRADGLDALGDGALPFVADVSDETQARP